MSHHAIDYFVTLGKSSENLTCKSFPIRLDEDSDPLTASQVWNEAITDIILLGPGEELPDEESWTFLTETINGHPIDPPYLAFRRRIFSHRQDHISHVRYVAPGEVVPSGYELLRSTASGKGSGYIKPFGFLALKRGLVNSDHIINGEEILFDICVIKHSLKEDIPEQYYPIEKDVASSMTPSFSSPDMVLITRKLPAMGICDLGYDASTLDRYPLQDDGMPLPVEALPVFAFPRHLRIQRGKRNEYPLPVFFTFVFTDQDGNHLYAACLKFFEILSPNSLEPIVKEIYGDKVELVLPADEAIFCPKVICVLTRKPFYRAMRRYLRHIYSISLSSAVCPLEYFLSTVVHQVPLPVEGGRPFHVVLDAALISVLSKPMSPIIFSLPPRQFFPPMDLDFAGPLRCLNIECMLAVFTLMLREAKLVFISCSNTMLTETMETLRMLLFPLSWSSCFVSRLPNSLHGLLQAPGGLMLGIHVEKAVSSTLTKNQEIKRFIDQMHYNYPLVTGTYVIDLTSSSIHQFNGRSVEKMQGFEIENVLKTLPNGPKLRLKVKLHKIAEEYRIAPQVVGLEEFDSAFDFQGSEENAIPREKWNAFPTLELRDSFMSFMIDLLGEYSKYIIPPEEDMLAETYRTFKEGFAVDQYLADADNSCRPVLDYLMETQMFSVLLQNRSEGNAEDIVFFEQSAQLQRELGLTAGGHGIPLAKSSHCVCEMPLPLYILRNKEEEWSSLTKVMQQQILSHRDPKKNYKLTCLTTSSLSPMRSGNYSSTPVNYTQQNVTNQKLQDLLLFNDFTYSIPQHHQDHESDSPYYAIARKELDRAEKLHLSKEDFGPVIIAGPTMNGTMEFTPHDEGHEIVYNYKSWPSLDVDRLTAGESAVHPRLKEIQMARIEALKKLNPSLSRMIRSPMERLNSMTSIIKGKTTNSMHPDTIPMLSAILDILSTSMTLLVVRIMNNIKPSNDMLQLLGMIAEIERANLLSYVNETVWRSMLIACGTVGGHVMRRFAYVIFQCMEAIRGVSANALTYGRYVQALDAKKLNMTEPIAGELADQFLFLEEIGFTWYIQKTALTAQNQIMQQHEDNLHNHNSIRKNSSSSDFSNGSSKLSKKVVVQANTEAARVVAAKLNLFQSQSYWSFMKPVQVSATTLPIKLASIASVANVDFISMRCRAYLDQLSAACMPSVRTYSSPPTPIPSKVNRQYSHSSESDVKSIGRDSILSSATPERLTNMISSISTSATLHVVTKLSTSWLPTGFRSAPNSIKNVAEQDIQKSTNSGTPQSIAIKSIESDKPSTGWRSFFGGRTPTSTASAPSLPVLHELKPASRTNNTAKEELMAPSPVDKDRIEDDMALGTLASTLDFDDDEDSSSNESGSERASSSHHLSTEKDHVDLPMIEIVNHNNLTEEAAVPSAVDDFANLTIQDPTQSVEVRPKSPSNASTSTTTERTAPDVNIIGELNDRVLDCFTQYFSDNGRVISIHSEHPCSCGYIPMDEEILGLWCRTANVDIHDLNSASAKITKRSKSEIILDPTHRTLCSNCGKEIAPRLHIMIHEKVRNDDENHHPLAITTEDIHITSKELDEVTYFSPFVLRMEVEDALLKVGEGLSNVDILYAYSPSLYWNIIWYTTRFSIPSGLFSIPLPLPTANGNSNSNENTLKFHGLPVIIGWSKHVVAAKSKRVLQGIPGDMLEVKDVFPYFSPDELKVIIDVVLTNLDGSPAGMRYALLGLARCKSLYQHAKEVNLKVERLIYTSAMVLAVHFAHFSIFDRKKASLALQRDLSQDCVFDKIFVDAIKCVMSQADFEEMQVDETVLMECANNRMANITRSIFGVLA